MCGLAGWFGTREPGNDPEETLRGMTAQIRHRGPDSAGGYISNRGALGAVRLAIRDREHGDQPFADPSARYRIAFNGEIYNDVELRDRLTAKGHKFRTACDTEVVLAAWMEWGADAFPLFEGGFALAIIDRESSRLILARDRFGKRPLHWTQFDGGWLFASEAKSFLAYPGWSFQWSEESLAGLFRFWATPPDRTVFKGVHQLPPGFCLQIDSGGVSPAQFGRMDFCDSSLEGDDFNSAKRETRSKISHAVRRRLRSDRKIGVALSGGLDSSIVLHEALTAGAEVSVFALAFEDPRFDESAAQDKVAKSFGVKVHRRTVSDREIAGALPSAVEHAESPLIRTACAPMMLLAESMQEHGMSVSLSGEGSDELFLGYDLFKEVMMEAGLIADSAPIYQLNSNPQDDRMLSAFLGQRDNSIPTEFATHRTRLRNSAFGLRALSTAASSWSDWQRWYREQEPAMESPIERARQLEMRSLMTGHLLSLQGDRMAMAHGIEHRTPFLDRSVVEWAHRLPPEWCVDRRGREKLILREAYRNALPAPVVDREKRPYLSPVASVIRSQPEYLELLRSEQELKHSPVLNVDFCQRLVNKVLNKSPERTSEREERTLVFALSTALLERGMMKRSMDPTDFKLEVERDLTSL